MLNEIKIALRIRHNALDTDIQQNIDACLLDLKRVGIDITGTSKLIVKACELYCKWQYDYMGKGEQFQKNYEKLANSLSLCKEYMAVDV